MIRPSSPFRRVQLSDCFYLLLAIMMVPTMIAAECERGYFNADYGASSCTPCPAGTFGSEAYSKSCVLCPSGSYQLEKGQINCVPCDPKLYAGLGSDSLVTNASGGIFCYKIPTRMPSTSPSPQPTFATTANPTATKDDRHWNNWSATITTASVFAFALISLVLFRLQVRGDPSVDVEEAVAEPTAEMDPKDKARDDAMMELAEQGDVTLQQLDDAAIVDNDNDNDHNHQNVLGIQFRSPLFRNRLVPEPPSAGPRINLVPDPPGPPSAAGQRLFRSPLFHNLVPGQPAGPARVTPYQNEEEKCEVEEEDEFETIANYAYDDDYLASPVPVRVDRAPNSHPEIVANGLDGIEGVVASRKRKATTTPYRYNGPDEEEGASPVVGHGKTVRFSNVDTALYDADNESGDGDEELTPSSEGSGVTTFAFSPISGTSQLNSVAAQSKDKEFHA